ncbi:Prp8 binding protein [Strigomonas culicis]|uniref:Prp8 binding protein n=1 Tax=Strigomonas culicis TaxID=28005 RepID=S9U4P1_9TRYP|nr:Prp8 binding protein [Strigomonas culicis]EPY25752.1 Prp8 binding protein [Strigomonas culicis]|eukprot:EPY24466.1 Prp8 binding protein [Strigomonas culicis]
MALSLLPQPGAERTEAGVCSWDLQGHDAEILGVAARGRVFASCGTDGLMLLWRLKEDDIANVCKLSTRGPAVTDVAFLAPDTLASAQADCTVGLWDVEVGKRTQSLSRMKVVERCSWPVINTLCARDGLLFYGGDDGYLVRHGAREGGAGCDWVNLKVPITALTVLGDSLFVGDVCGAVHWYDIRNTMKKIASIQCASDVITGIAALSDDQIATYSMDDKVAVIDVQPFVLEGGERLLTAIDMRQGGERTSLKRCSALPRRDLVAFATADATVSCVKGSALYKGVTKTYTCSQVNGVSVNATAFVSDDYLVCGGDKVLSVVTIS